MKDKGLRLRKATMTHLISLNSLSVLMVVLCLQITMLSVNSPFTHLAGPTLTPYELPFYFDRKSE